MNKVAIVEQSAVLDFQAALDLIRALDRARARAHNAYEKAQRLEMQWRSAHAIEMRLVESLEIMEEIIGKIPDELHEQVLDYLQHRAEIQAERAYQRQKR